MSERIISLTDAEASQAARGELRAIVRKAPDAPSDNHRIVRFEKPAMLKGRYGWKADNEPMIPPYFKCPFGAPGDTLACRESWRPIRAWNGSSNGCVIQYKSDSLTQQFDVCLAVPKTVQPWRSPITMPALAIRRRFTVKSVRVFQPVGMRNLLMAISGKSFELSDWLWYAEVEPLAIGGNE